MLARLVNFFLPDLFADRLQPGQDGRLRARFDGQQDAGAQAALPRSFAQFQGVARDDARGL